MTSELTGFPLSREQNWLWSRPGGAANAWTQCVVAVPPHRSPDELAAAIARVVQRYEILRTGFVHVRLRAGAVQVIHDAAEPELIRIDGRGRPAVQVTAEVLRRQRTPADLDRPPLLRAAHITEADNEAVLILSAPAIAVDARAMCTLVGEIEAAVEGRETPSDDVVQYADYAQWSVDQGAAPALPTPGPTSPAVATDPVPEEIHSVPVPVPMPSGLGPSLLTLVDAHDLRPSAVLLAAWQLTLAIAGFDRAGPVWVTVDGRAAAGLDGAIGWFEQRQSLPAPSSRVRTFVEFARMVSDWYAQTVPDPQHTPAAETAVAGIGYRYIDLSATPTGGFRLRRLLVVDPATTVDLTVWNGADGLGMEISSADADAPLLGQRLAALLGVVCAGGDLPLAQIDVRTPTERAAENRRNATDADTPQTTVVDRFRARLRIAPDAPAVVWDGGRLSYADVDERAGQIADALRARGCRRGDRVGIALARSPDQVAAVLGVWYAGAVMVALNPAEPAPWLRRLTEIAGCRLLLVDELPPEPATTEQVSVPEALKRPAGEGGSAYAAGPDATAYVAFTSGSTGTPRGVLGSGRGLANYLAYVTGEYGLDPSDVVLQLAPFTFDAWFRDCLAPLTVGACVVMVDELTSRSAGELVLRIDRHGVTRLLHTVPTVLRELTRAARERPPGRATLRTVLCSGEALRRADCAQTWATFGAQVTIVNQYGPTEGTLTSTYYRTSPADADGTGPLPIGRPIRNVRAYLLDESLRMVPDGVTGELCLGGAGVSHGYLGEPALTAQRFVPDPFAGRPGARMYRTGDLARSYPDGRIELAGRRDDQVKIHGVRIEPAEVEAALADHPSVRDAAVVACHGLPPDPDAPTLVAWVVLAGDGAQAGERADRDAAMLRAFLAERVPPQRIPSHFLTTDALPRNRHGKVDRRRLVTDSHRRAGELARAQQIRQPQSRLEQIVVEVFARTLNREQIGVDADFFVSGGHSLLATEAVHRLSAALEVRVPLRTIFESPTAAGLAVRIREEADADDVAYLQQLAESPPGAGPHDLAPGRTPAAGTIPRQPGDGPLPLSFAQRRMWLIEALYPGDTSHNVQVTAKIVGALSVDSLRQALSYLAGRHEALRTKFVVGSDGEPGQMIFPPTPVDMAIVDLTGDRTGENTAILLSRYSRSQANTPFDLTRPPLWRVCLLRTEPDTHILLLTAHHIAIDEWSVGVLLRELVQAYTAILGGEEPDLPPPPIRYLDFAAWQRDQYTKDRLAGLVEHWRARVCGAAFELELPTDFPRPSSPSMNGERIAAVVPQSLVERLTAIGRPEGATLFMVLLAAYASLLAHYGKRSDIVLGTPVANRDHPAVEGVVGCFVNILVLRVRGDGDPLFAELLRRVRETALDAFAHQDAPFEKVVEALRPSRALGRMPLVQNWFVLHNAARPVLRAPGIELTLLESDRGSAKFDLNLALSETADGLSVALEYSTDLFLRSTAQRLLTRYQQLLEWIAQEPGRSLSELHRQVAEHDGREQKMTSPGADPSGRRTFAAMRATTVRPMRVGGSQSTVRTSRLLTGSPLPVLVTPADQQIDLAAWVQGNRAAVTEWLHRDGVLLFRGFTVASVEAFERVVRAYSDRMLDYYERSTPRQLVSGKVYSSTEYPPERTIPLHPESAYSHYWPRTLWFCCLTAAEQGGATPVADNRKILAALEPAVRDRFSRLGVRYVRTYHEGFDIPWQTAFQTDDREVVEEYCRRTGMNWQWRDGVLRTEHVLDAVVRHPDTGEDVWFNQVHAWHISVLDPQDRQAMRDAFGDDDLPRNVYYGDGTPIGDDEMGAIKAAHDSALVRFDWHPGDLMLIDNMLAAHGRDPFSGNRRVVVAMTDPYDRERLGAAR